MADRWMEERDRRMRERDRDRDRDWRRSDDIGRGDQRRYAGGEDRSWSGQGERDEGRGGREWQGRRYQGVSPAMQQGEYDLERRAERYQSEHPGTGANWQDRHYQGVSPAMQHGEYDLERRAERYQSEHPVRSNERVRVYPDQGGRYYGDAGRERIYREEWSQGGRDTGPAPRGYDADHDRGHFDEDYENRLFTSGVASGGTGGYDYERGYGDGGRQRYSEGRFGVPRDRGERWEQRGREAGQETGDFFRRTGERVASWFGGGEHERDYRGEGRGFRGKGPKGYKRNDERISDEVHERLTDDPWLDASNISINVSNGEVTLSGTVENREAKHRAERVIEDCSGVNHVQNNLRVENSMLTGPGKGYGDSVLEHQMRGETGAGDSIGGGLRQGGDQSRSGGDQSSTSSTPNRTTSSSTDTGKSR